MAWGSHSLPSQHTRPGKGVYTPLPGGDLHLSASPRAPGPAGARDGRREQQTPKLGPVPESQACRPALRVGRRGWTLMAETCPPASRGPILRQVSWRGRLHWKQGPPGRRASLLRLATGGLGLLGQDCWQGRWRAGEVCRAAAWASLRGSLRAGPGGPLSSAPDLRTRVQWGARCRERGGAPALWGDSLRVADCIQTLTRTLGCQSRRGLGGRPPHSVSTKAPEGAPRRSQPGPCSLSLVSRGAVLQLSDHRNPLKE